MAQNYIIFSNNRPIEIAWDSTLKSCVRISLGRRTEEFDLKKKSLKEPLTKTLIEFEQGSYDKIQLKTDDPEKLFEILRTCYDQELTAGGGVVFNKKHKILWIHRKGKWDLPKGKIEEGEAVLDGSVREVMEETGLEKVEPIILLMKTYHTYEQKGKRIFKETVWYLMRSNGKNLVPQEEEGITDVAWVDSNDLDQMYANTYKNIKIVLDHLIGKLAYT